MVIGGGYFGSYHTRQLLKAMRRGKVLAEPLLVVDRDPGCAAASEFAGAPEVQLVVSDWHAFLLQHFPNRHTHAGDQIVPAPFAPHLLYDWLAASVQPALVPQRVLFEIPLGLPYELTHEGNRFISAAGWQCPATCIEPASCPAIRAPRTWELGDIVRAHATPDEGISGVEVFHCKHYAYGVGTIPARRLLEARQNVLDRIASDGGARVAVATVSSCHGVVAVLEIPCS